MASWLENKYINLLSTRLEKFKKRSNNLYNFRCPICNDSETNKNKTRGYIYEKSGNMLFYCHNCGKTLGFVSFLKLIDFQLYREYIVEKIKDEKPPEMDESIFNSVPIFTDLGPIKKLKKISELDKDNEARIFIEKRKIPEDYLDTLYYCPNFMSFTNKFIPSKFKENALLYDEARILIPFINEEKKLHGYNGRSFKANTDKRYISIRLDNSIPFLYGLSRINPSKTVYVLEGPFDSMFIDNSLATGGGNLITDFKTADKDKIVIVYDNEKRNKDTIHKIEKAILNDYKVVIWPSEIEEKDINDMVLAGYSIDHIMSIIETSTYSGLMAKIKLSEWKKY
jgi:transcription elongation factor Elf1